MLTPSVAASFAVSPLAPAAVLSGATTVHDGSPWKGTCSGKSLDTNRVNATTVKVTCTAQPVPIRNVGGATTFTSPGSSAPSTPLPKGTAAGDVLVSVVETYSAATVTFPEGWTKASDATNGTGYSGARLVTAWRIAGEHEAPPTATVSPGTQVSMVSMAFSGVDTDNPVEAAKAAAGVTSPSVMTATMGDLLVLGQGSANWQTDSSAPTGAMLGAAANNHGNAQVAAATHVLKGTGRKPRARLEHGPGSDCERLQHPGAPPGVPRCDGRAVVRAGHVRERLGHADTHRDADTDSHADRHADALGHADSNPHADVNAQFQQPKLARVRAEHSPGEDLRLHACSTAPHRRPLGRCPCRRRRTSRR